MAVPLTSLFSNSHVLSTAPPVTEATTGGARESGCTRFFTWRNKFEPAIKRSKLQSGILTADDLHSECRIGRSHLYGNLRIPAVRVPNFGTPDATDPQFVFHLTVSDPALRVQTIGSRNASILDIERLTKTFRRTCGARAAAPPVAFELQKQVAVGGHPLAPPARRSRFFFSGPQKPREVRHPQHPAPTIDVQICD